MKQLGDIAQINWNDIEPVDVVTGGSPCITADSLILTKDGYTPILDINVGDEVLTKSNTWQRVAKKFSNGVHDTCFISGHGFENIHCTLNHKFYARTSRRYGHYGKKIFSEPEFVEAKDLTSKHYIGLPVIETERQFYTDTPEFWWFIGYYLGDGWIQTQRNEICLACNTEKLKKIRQHMPQKEWKYTAQDSGTCLKLRFCNKAIYNFIETNIGTGCFGKRITADIINLPKNLLMQLFNGYLDSDGCKIKDCYQFSTVNRSLAYGMSLIINKLFHRPCCIYKVKTAPKTHICGREVNQHDWYQLRFSAECHRQDHSFYEGGYLWLQFRKRINAEDEPVYNMEVENDHSYILQGIISKNCQDLSVAGKREGLAGERSGLYMEQIRCWRELRNADIRRGHTDELVRPRYGIWENVPGAFSSNKGEDFAAVLTEAIRVVEPEAPNVSVPESGWPYSGYIYDELGKWSVAWRTHDAQFWGTALWPLPQRRRRISLVCDFGGTSAAQILFKSEGLPWNSEAGGETGEETAGGTGTGIENSGGSNAGGTRRWVSGTSLSTGVDSVTNKAAKPISFQGQAGSEASLCIGHDVSASLVANKHADVYVPTSEEEAAYSFEPGILRREGGHYYKDVSGTLRANAGDNQMAVAYGIPKKENNGGAMYIDTSHADDVVRVDDVTAPLQARDYKGGKLICMATSCANAEITDNDIAPSLLARAGTGGNQLPLVCKDKETVTAYGMCSLDSNAMKSANPHSGIYKADTSRTLDLNGGNPACNQGGIMIVQPVYGVTTKGNGDAFISKEKHTSLSCGGGEAGQGYPCVLTTNEADTSKTRGFAMQAIGEYADLDVASSLKQRDYKDATDLIVQKHTSGVDFFNQSETGSISKTLNSAATDSDHVPCVRSNKAVRRLTPLECERLQGYPDEWTLLPQKKDMSDEEYKFWCNLLLENEKLKGVVRANSNGIYEIWKYIEETDDSSGTWINTKKLYKDKTKKQMISWYNKMVKADSHRYKALGNSIALPFWQWLLLNISETYDYTPTLGSLFDGIGGFPLCWERINGKGTARWASEIEEFPIAVTRIRFGEK